MAFGWYFSFKRLSENSLRPDGKGPSTTGSLLGVYWLGPPNWDLEDHTLEVYSGSVHSGSLQNLGPPILDLADLTLGVYFGSLHSDHTLGVYSGSLHSGSLLPRATEFGSG